MNINTTKNYSISMIRLISMFMIIICHMMQYKNFVLAWWFNVGVQIFLCMSGYLYGKKEIENELLFYKKQFKKILIDYYIVISVIILLQFLLLKFNVSVSYILGIFSASTSLNGGEHLWFIPYILLCYFLTPIIIKIFNLKYRENNFWNFTLTFLNVLLIIFILSRYFITFFNSAWINCYIIGLFFGFIEKNKKEKNKKLLFLIMLILAIIMNCFQIYINYFSDIQFSGKIYNFYMIFCDYAHVMLGCSLFFGLKAFMNKVLLNKKLFIIKKVCDFTDKLSYDIYLVHQFIILGPLSLMAITDYFVLNVVIIFILVFVAALIINKISNLISIIIKFVTKNNYD